MRNSPASPEGRAGGGQEVLQAPLPGRDGPAAPAETLVRSEGVKLSMGKGVEWREGVFILSLSLSVPIYFNWQ